MRQRLSTFFINKPVITKDGKELGEVKDIYLDTDGWRVLSLRVQLGSEVAKSLNLGDLELLTGEAVKLGVNQISGVEDVVTLDKPLEGLSFDKKHDDEQ